VTNSNPTVVERVLALPPAESVFEVLDILPLLVDDL
jgi:hypothetical protein